MLPLAAQGRIALPYSGTVPHNKIAAILVKGLTGFFKRV